MRAEGDFAEIVPRILGCIGSGEGESETWVSPDGCWRHGLLRGAWEKPAAEYLGHAAREEARLRRIAELETVAPSLDESIASLTRSGERIEDRARQTERNAKTLRTSVRCNARLTRLRAQRRRAPRRAPGSMKSINCSAKRAKPRTQPARHGTAMPPILVWPTGRNRQRSTGMEALLAEARVKAATLWPAWDALLPRTKRARESRRPARRRRGFHSTRRRPRARGATVRHGGRGQLRGALRHGRRDGRPSDEAARGSPRRT